MNPISNHYEQELFDTFIHDYNLGEYQAQQFLLYISLLLSENKKFNITAITDFSIILADHCRDSLALINALDITAISSLADVGTGGGFPAIPLKIYAPHLAIVLIEVNTKKANFLSMVIEQLSLTNMTISSLDWRTFLRTTDYSIDVAVARASLPVDELIRMFSPVCHYHNALLVYWASTQWYIRSKEKQYFDKEIEYKVGNKQRRLIFFKYQQ